MSSSPAASLSGEMIAALDARGPWPGHADRLMLFGQFVGAWDVDVTLFNLDGAVLAEGRGEWLFGWVLDGRAVQDVLIRPPRVERARLMQEDPSAGENEFWEYGTTIRVYDPRIDAWRVTWIAPVQGRMLNLVGRPSGDEIVLDSEEQQELSFRWVFSEISADSCHWRGSASDDGGQTWLVLQEMQLRRRHEPVTPWQVGNAPCAQFLEPERGE